VQDSRCVQVLCSPILAALLHNTQVVGISETAALSRGRHLYSPGWPSRWALAHILVVTLFSAFTALMLLVGPVQKASACTHTAPLINLLRLC